MNGTGVNMHQRGGSLNIHELYQHYHQKPKGMSQRTPNYQPNSGPPQAIQSNMIGAVGVSGVGLVENGY